MAKELVDGDANRRGAVEAGHVGEAGGAVADPISTPAASFRRRFGAGLVDLVLLSMLGVAGYEASAEALYGLAQMLMPYPGYGGTAVHYGAYVWMWQYGALGLWIVGFQVVAWVYLAGFFLWRSATPGKLLVGCRVVDVCLRRPRTVLCLRRAAVQAMLYLVPGTVYSGLLIWGALTLLRNPTQAVLVVVAGAMLLLGLAYGAVLSSRGRQAWHDRLSGTMVVQGREA